MPSAFEIINGEGSAPKGPNKALEILGGKQPKAAKSKKKGGSILSKAKSGALGVLGVATDALSMPQQVVYKAGQGLGDIAQGDVGSGLKGLAGAGGEVLSLGQAGGDIGFSEAITSKARRDAGQIKKLPKGVETFVNVVGDPTNFVTLGSGAVAKGAAKSLVREGEEALAKKIAKEGLKSLDDVERATVKETLLRGAEGVAKNPEKTVGKQLKQLGVRGRGGVTLRVPGTSMAKTVVSGDELARAGAATRLTDLRDAAKVAPGIQQARQALVSMARVKDELGAATADKVKSVLSNRTAEGHKRLSDLLTQLDSGIKSYNAAGKEFDVVDDAFVHRALVGGEEARLAAAAERPELAHVIESFDQIRKTMGREQFEAKVLKNLRNEEGYLHRDILPEAQKALNQATKAESGQIGSVASDLRQNAGKARVVAPGSMPEEINEAVGLVQRGEQVPDGLLRDRARVTKLQEPVLRRMDEIQAQLDDLRLRGTEAPTGPLTEGARRKMAADAEKIRRLEAELKRETHRAAQVGTAGARAAEAVGAKADRAVGNIMGRTRGQLEEAAQLGRGEAARAKQNLLRSERLAKRAGQADDALADVERTAVEQGVSPRRMEQAMAKAGRTADAADEAAGNVLPGVRAPRTTQDIIKSSAQASRRVEDIAKAESEVTSKLVGGEMKRQESALVSAARRLDAAKTEAADRAARYAEEAAARSARADKKLAAHLTERLEGLNEQLALKSKQAEEETLAVVIDIAQKLQAGGVDKLYGTSAVKSILDRGVEASKALSSAMMMNDLRAVTIEGTKQKLVMAADELVGDVPKGFEKFELPKLGEFYAPKSVKDEVMKFQAIVGQDAAVKAFQQHLRTADRWWKTMVTVHPVGGVAFGMRNARSNAWLTFADGMNPKWFGTARSFQKQLGKIKETHAAEIAKEGFDAVLRRELPEREFKLYDAAMRKGIIGEGFFDLDIAGTPKIRVGGAKDATKGGRLGRAVKAAVGSEGAASNAGRKFNQAIEQNARLAHFMHSADRLGNLEEAALRTKAVLFDYSDLTPFEQRILKKVVPFWTFMRKIVPAEFRAIAENPARALLPEKVSQLLTEPLDGEGPEYQRRAGARQIREGIPFIGGMVTTPERPLQAAAKTLEPLAQLGAALAPGKQGKLEPEKGFGQAARSLLAPMGGVPGSQLKALAEEAGDVDLFTGYRLNPEERRERAATEILPPLGRVPVSLINALPEKVRDALFEERRATKGAEQPAATDILNLLGIKMEPPSKAQKKRKKR